MGIRCTEQAKLDGLKKMIGVIAARGWIGELAQRTAAAGMKLVGDEFRKQQDPYGKAWAPLARERTRDRRARLRAIAKGKTPRGGKVLHKTGRMENSAGASATGRLVNVVVPVDYAGFHQGGTKAIPQRKILPDAQGGIPSAWQKMLRKESALLIAQKMGKRS